jgi:amidase
VPIDVTPPSRTLRLNAMDSDIAVRTRRAALFAILIFALWSFFRTGSMGLPSTISGRASWKTIAAERRAEIHKKIPTEWLLPSAVLEKGKQEKRIVGSFIEGLLDSDTLKITSLDPVEIASRIATGALTSVKVVTAFCKRAAFAHQLVRTPRSLSSVFTIR